LTTKRLGTLVQDIYSLFEKGHSPTEENLDIFASKCRDLVKHSLESTGKVRDVHIRMSNLGTPDRKLYYTIKAGSSKETRISEFKPSDLIKFVYGHLVEELLLLLVKEAGHSVTNEQEEISIDGVLGHRDCKIDGVPIDVKSASRFSFQKFSNGSLVTNDPFGYIAQISGYVQADNDKDGGFLAINKESGEIALLLIDPIDMIDIPKRIKTVREFLSKDTPPDKCYPDEPYGASGNRGLNKNCAMCPFKKSCWSDANNGTGLRAFQYSTYVDYLTTVAKTPSVSEVSV